MANVEQSQGDEEKGSAAGETALLSILLKCTSGINEDVRDRKYDGLSRSIYIDDCYGSQETWNNQYDRSKKDDRYGDSKQFFVDMSVNGTSQKLRKEDSKNRNKGGYTTEGKKEQTGFSRKSRGNLLWTMGRLNRGDIDKKSVKFITLTYDGDTEKWLDKMDGREYKRHLKNITTAITRKYGGFAVWRWELQERLLGHWHLIWYQVKDNWIDHDWLCNRWNEIIEGNQENIDRRADIQTAESWKGVHLYACKSLGYIAKREQDDRKIAYAREIRIGRHWGTVNKRLLNDFCETEEVQLTQQTYLDMERNNNKKQFSWRRKSSLKNGDNSFRSGSTRGIDKFQSRLSDFNNVQHRFHQDYEIIKDELEFFANGKLSYQRIITADGIKRVSRTNEVVSERRSRILELREKTKFSKMRAQRITNFENLAAMDSNVNSYYI